ncbi:MAG: hypothetical protein MZV64_52680 [Ignavibacteriales bacterium]|nr:hypothetical protein [Ignavibacteriales bacterium]
MRSPRRAIQEAVGEPVVDGHDLAVDEDQVGRLGGLLLAAVDEEEDGEDGDDDDDESQAAVSFGHGVSPSRPGSPGDAQKIYRSRRPVNRGLNAALSRIR